MNKVVLLVVVFLSCEIVYAESSSDKQSSNGTTAEDKQNPGSPPALPDLSSDEKDDDKAGQSLSSDKSVQQGLTELELAYKDAVSAVQAGQVTINPVGHEEFVKFADVDYLENKQNCVDRHKYAAWACIEALSSHMIEGAAALNGITALVGGMAVKDNCSKFAGAMDVASKALTAYTAACGAAKLFCGKTCQTADEGIEGMLNTQPDLHCVNIPAVPPKPQTDACGPIKDKYRIAVEKIKKAAQEENKDSDKLSVSAKKSLCTQKYAQLAMSAVAGIASLAKSIMQGKDCKKNTEGAPDPLKVALPNLPATPPSAEKCADPAYASLPECLCLKNPRTPGCANAYQKPGESNGRQLTADPGSRFKTNDRGIAGLPGSSGIPGIDPRNVSGVDGGGSAASGSSGGGGAGLGGGGGGSGGGAAPGAGQDGAGGGIDLSKYDTGFAGGGGGGGRWGGGNGSSKYRAYLPGGAKDPRKNLAGQQAWTKEVTGQAGKSNWEKVKDRYRDNKSTLLNN